MASIKSWLLHLHGPIVYVVVGLLVFFELAVVIGFFVPGEIAAIIGGVIASQHHANVVLMIVIVVALATVGNVVGFEVGRLIGPWMFARRPLAGNGGVAKAQDLISRRGGPAVIAGRFVAVVRAILPGLVGMSGMSRRAFALFSAVGAIVWGVLWVLVGFGLGLSYTKVTNDVGPVTAVVVAAIVVAGLALVGWRRHRRSRTSAGPEDG